MGRRSPFTPAEKRDAVLAELSERKTISEVCRDKGISAQTFARWREQAMEGMAEALADKADRNSREADPQRRLAEAERTVGRLALAGELVGGASRRLT